MTLRSRHRRRTSSAHGSLQTHFLDLIHKISGIKLRLPVDMRHDSVGVVGSGSESHLQLS